MRRNESNDGHATRDELEPWLPPAAAHYSHSCLIETSGSMRQTALTATIFGKHPRTFCNIH
jgi:hypothetical protein